MNELDSLLKLLMALWPIPLAAIVLAILGGRGLLQRRAILAGPNRRVGLGVGDILIGFGLVVVGLALLPPVLPMVVAVDAETGRPAAGAVGDHLLVVLLGQLFMQVPVVAFLVWRVGRARGMMGLWRTGLLPRRPIREMGVGAMAVLAAMPLVLATMTLTTIVSVWIGLPAPELSHDLLPVFQVPGQLAAKIGLVVAVVVVAPLVEEAVYRGLVQSALAESLGPRRRWLAVVIASAVFAVIHLGAVTWHALPALFVLAVILGWLYERTGSLWPSIILHAGFNAFNVAMVLFVVEAA